MFGDWKLIEVPAWNLLSQSLWIGYRPIPASSPRIPLGLLRGEISAASLETRQPIRGILPTNERECFANRTDRSPVASAHQPSMICTPAVALREILRWKTLPVSKAGDFWSTHTDVHVIGAECILLASVGKARRKRIPEICIPQKRVSERNTDSRSH